MVNGNSTAPFLSYLAKNLVDMSGDPRERQWLHQCLSMAVVRGNTAIILPACKLDLILTILTVLTSATCFFSMNNYCIPTVCVFGKFCHFPNVSHFL